MNIFVAKLSASTTQESLKNLFEGYGEVSASNVIFDKQTGRSKRFGFVEMPNDDEANQAINGLNESTFEDSTIVVQEAKDKEDRPQGDRPRNNFNDRKPRGSYSDNRRGGDRGGYGSNDRGSNDRGGYNKSSRSDDSYNF